jgi:hypothetical protein
VATNGCHTGSFNDQWGYPCPANCTTCSNSTTCATGCVGTCTGRYCGTDGCPADGPNACNPCPAGEECSPWYSCDLQDCTVAINGCHTGSFNDQWGYSCPANCDGPNGTVGTCNTSGTECLSSCVGTCTERECGTDGCSADGPNKCGSCPQGMECDPWYSCCQPNCANANTQPCAADNCGYYCGTSTGGGTCPAGDVCNMGQCVVPGGSTTCLPDCNACNNSNFTDSNCSAPCNANCAGTCNLITNTCSTLCIPNCEDGQCHSNYYTDRNQCLANDCYPNCTQPDSCNAAFTQCSSGNCIPNCPCSATGGSSDGCGGTCLANCTTPNECNTTTGLCCTPNCSGVVCGASDSCGGICQTGSCASGTCVNGTCQ